MLLLDSLFSQIRIEPENSLILHRWKDNPEMNDEDFKQEHIDLIRIYKENSPSLFLSDMSASDFVISPTIQTWMANLIATEFTGESPLQKIAVIPSRDFISRLSSEQNIEEVLEKRKAYVSKVQIQYFQNDTDAMGWLLETNNTEEKDEAKI